jgi:hypothetical protein
MADEYGTAIRYRIMLAAARPQNSRVAAKVQDKEILQLCVDPEVEHEHENKQGSSCCTAVPAPLTAAVRMAREAAADAAAATAEAAEHQCVSTICIEEEKRQHRRRRRNPLQVAVPPAFESVPVLSSADESRMRNTVSCRIISHGDCVSTFENAPTPSSADAVAGDFAMKRSTTPNSFFLAQSTFESKPLQSTADVSHADSNNCGPVGDGIFESAPIGTVATVTHAETMEASCSDKDQHIFESQPLQSFASVRHGERAAVEDTQTVFESKPVASKAHAKAGVDGVDSESEYETDDDTCEPVDTEEETTAEEA